MKKIAVLLTVCFVSLGVGPSFAQSPHTLEIAPEVSHIEYEEPGVMKNEGIMYGIAGALTYQEMFMMRIEARFAYGSVDYTSNNTGQMDDVNDYLFQWRLLGGYSFSMSDGPAYVLTPYLGFGYRYLNDDSGGMTTTTGHRGYERESNYYYIPIGADFHGKSDKGWVIGTKLEYDYFLVGRQKSHLGDAVSGYNTVENDQNDGYGLRGSIYVRKKVADIIEFGVEPFVRYWDIDESDMSYITYQRIIIGYGYEPANETTEYGVKVSIRF